MTAQRKQPLGLRCPECGSGHLAEFGTVPLVCRDVAVWRDQGGELHCDTDGTATRVCWDGYLHAGLRCEACDREGSAAEFVREPLPIAGRYLDDTSGLMIEAAIQFARDLMCGDPDACKAGYSPANAGLAARDAFALAHHEYDQLCEAIGASS